MKIRPDERTSAELWLVARATGTCASSTPSFLLQLPLELREPCDEDDVLRPPSSGLHQNVGREAASLCLRVCVLVCGLRMQVFAGLDSVGRSPQKQ